LPPQKTFPRAWRVVHPAIPHSLLADYRAAQAATGVPGQILAAVDLIEMRMSRIRGPSIAGAQGPVQLMPTAWSMYGHGDIGSNNDSNMAAAPCWSPAGP